MKDETVQKTASLHESSVQAIARGEVAPTPKTRRRGRQNGNPPVAESWEITAHPLALAAAKKLLGGTSTYSTIEIVDETTLMVR